MNPKLIEAKITEKTRLSCQFISMVNLRICTHLKDCKKIQSKVIEDACQAHGAEYNGRKIGAFGDLVVLVFILQKIWVLMATVAWW